MSAGRNSGHAHLTTPVCRLLGPPPVTPPYLEYAPVDDVTGWPTTLLTARQMHMRPINGPNAEWVYFRTRLPHLGLDLTSLLQLLFNCISDRLNLLFLFRKPEIYWICFWKLP